MPARGKGSFPCRIRRRAHAPVSAPRWLARRTRRGVRSGRTGTCAWTGPASPDGNMPAWDATPSKAGMFRQEGEREAATVPRTDGPEAVACHRNRATEGASSACSSPSWPRQAWWVCESLPQAPDRIVPVRRSDIPASGAGSPTRLGPPSGWSARGRRIRRPCRNPTSGWAWERGHHQPVEECP